MATRLEEDDDLEEDDVVNVVDVVGKEEDEKLVVSDVVKRKHKRLPTTLSAAEVLDERKGLRAVYQSFRTMKAKGDALADLHLLIKRYQGWQQRMAPQFSLADTVRMLDKSSSLLKKSQVADYLNQLRQEEYDRAFPSFASFASRQAASPSRPPEQREKEEDQDKQKERDPEREEGAWSDSESEEEAEEERKRIENNKNDIHPVAKRLRHSSDSSEDELETEEKTKKTRKLNIQNPVVESEEEEEEEEESGPTIRRKKVIDSDDEDEDELE